MKITRIALLPAAPLLWAGLAAAESFSFTPINFADRNATVISDAVTAGTSESVSIIGGEYSINGAAFTAAPGAANPGDTITVRQISSTQYNTKTSAIITVGGIASSFDVTTGIREHLTTTSGSALISGTTVTMSSVVNGTAPPPECGTTAAPFVLGPGDSYTFIFKRSPSSVLITTGLTDFSGRMRYRVDGIANDTHSFTIPGRLADSNCGPSAASSSSDGSGAFVQANGSSSSGVLRAHPLFSMVLSNPGTTPVSFGMYIPPILGTDFDALGTSGLLLFDANHAQYVGMRTNQLVAIRGSTVGTQPLGSAGWKPVRIGDLIHGGGGADVLLQNDDGRAVLYYPAFGAQAPIPVVGAGSWKIVAAADLDGDGIDDLIFQNADDGSVAIWIMSVTFAAKTTYQESSGGTILGPGTGWSVQKVADFDGDGKADILWKNVDGRHAIWLMNGITPTATAEILPAGDWTAIQVADLDGDGKADIVWQNADGTLAAWLMNGLTMTSGTTLLNAGSGWTVTHTADFNADGSADLLFRHTDGRAAIWLMNGLVPTAQAEILPAGTGWTAKRIGDFNGDESMDIAWQHDDGRVAIWLMSGTSLLSGSEVLAAGTGWVLDTLGP